MAVARVISWLIGSRYKTHSTVISWMFIIHTSSENDIHDACNARSLSNGKPGASCINRDLLSQYRTYDIGK